LLAQLKLAWKRFFKLASAMQPIETAIGSISTAQLCREREAWHRFQKKQFQSTSSRDMGSIMIMPEENVSPFHLSSRAAVLPPPPLCHAGLLAT
jgi:hypothetical protein